MEKYLRVHTFIGGFVRIAIGSGHLTWEKNDLPPACQEYAEKYLTIEGFIEQANGRLDPAPDNDVKTMLDSILLF
jgi:hypothetical protein